VAEAGLCSGLRCAGLSRLTASAASEYADEMSSAPQKASKRRVAPLIGAVLVGKNEDGGWIRREQPRAGDGFAALRAIGGPYHDHD
jgi:hypothetical protein